MEIYHIPHIFHKFTIISLLKLSVNQRQLLNSGNSEVSTWGSSKMWINCGSQAHVFLIWLLVCWLCYNYAANYHAKGIRISEVILNWIWFSKHVPDFKVVKLSNKNIFSIKTIFSFIISSLLFEFSRNGDGSPKNNKLKGKTRKPKKLCHFYNNWIFD